MIFVTYSHDSEDGRHEFASASFHASFPPTMAGIKSIISQTQERYRTKRNRNNQYHSLAGIPIID